MNITIIITAYNEASYLPKTLDSLLAQTYPAKAIWVVNDNSTDDTQQIIDTYRSKHKQIQSVQTNALQRHEPGSKVVRAFQTAYKNIEDDFDILCKFDADLIFPKDYLETIQAIFKQHPKCGIAGGFCSILNNEKWQLERLTDDDHVRGALKAYRKPCYEAIGGLKNTMGWDTIDELLARFHGWEVITEKSLVVKHLKPTGNAYHATSKYKQGEAFKKMRYGWWLTLIASVKLALRKQSLSFFWNTMRGYHRYSGAYVVSEAEGAFIRNYRWRNIRKKLGLEK